MNKTTKGFTLIELLVVISLLGLLAALALVSYTGTQKQARDVQRKSDLKQYQNSVEIFANKNNGIYVSRTSATGITASITLCGDLLLSSCPEDPRYDNDNTFIYRYQSDGTGGGGIDATQYVLWGKLENTEDYWVMCSDGKTGGTPQSGFVIPSGGNCPL
jgi:prepilin-type N-terminal cleavage/methylation domain-containing protein